MAQFDIVIRGGLVVTPRDVLRLDLGITGGWIVAFQPDIDEPGRKETIDATGLHLFPGVVDPHVHFNEPGRENWEGFVTGSQAFVAGGGAVFFDMPLNSTPPLLNVEAFNIKRTLACSAHADFALWGGLTPKNVDQVEKLWNRGVIGLKAFLCDSGIEEFPAIDEASLRAAMKRAAPLKIPIAVHAESDTLTRQLTQERLEHGLNTIRDWLDSRPIEAELQSIQRVLELAEETGCRLHIVHVSCGEGIDLIEAARERGVDVSCETCPHYLTLTEEDVFNLGASAKCSPPLRSKASQDRLWEHVLAGRVDMIGSDHSPALPEMKTGDDFFKIWGGISGVQHTLPLMIDEAHHKRGLELPAITRLTSHNAAARFQLRADKGGIKIGAQADIAFVDLNAEWEIRREDLLQRHPISPYVGRKVRGKVVRTMIFSRTVYLDGKIIGKHAAQLLKHQPLI